MGVLIHIGFWGIYPGFGLTGKIRPGYEYRIAARHLWRTCEFDGRTLYVWPLILMRKYWIHAGNAGNLFTALFFAQEYFKDYKPANRKEDASWPATIFLVKNMLDLSEDLQLKEHSRYKGDRMLVSPELYGYAVEVMRSYGSDDMGSTDDQSRPAAI